jgi:outer membrane protein OmpA-like peptidoglycan-associated protein
MKSRFGIVLLASLLILSSQQVAAVELDDHPLITRYPESVLSKKDVKDFDEYKLIVGLGDEGELQSKALQGKVTRLNYYSPTGRSILEIFKNYEDALQGVGAEMLFQCAKEECGPAYAASAWNRMNGITAKSGSDCQYLAAQLTSENSEVYVAIMVGKRRHQIDLVEIKAMETGLVQVDAAAMAGSIDRLGYVSLYGIYFDTGKSELKSESKPTLQEIADLLATHQDWKLYVVGHTDNVGALDFNLQLARERAAAVVKALVEEHGVDRARLEPHGVGPLVPRATNASDTGRGKNRRVELVKQ